MSTNLAEHVANKRTDRSTAPAHPPAQQPTLVQFVQKLRPEIDRALPAHVGAPTVSPASRFRRAAGLPLIINAAGIPQIDPAALEAAEGWAADALAPRTRMPHHTLPPSTNWLSLVGRQRVA
ncbi:hypothetical protein [Streptomyces sp. NPDC056464]|uniref:hypothetical protein n=1 Tax=Streptomyces sp. NPDC056464 TaxID=3345828 RepID=UPI0036A72805